MEILVDSEAPVLLTNTEVMTLLKKQIGKRKEEEKKRKHKRKRPNTKFQHRDWIESTVHAYLQTTPCVYAPDDPKALQSQLCSSKKTSTQTTGFSLTEAEALQAVNFMPKELVEIHLMVEELHSRMTEEKQEELLTLIQSHRKKESDVDMEVVEYSSPVTTGTAGVAVANEAPMVKDEVL